MKKYIVLWALVLVLMLGISSVALAETSDSVKSVSGNMGTDITVELHGGASSFPSKVKAGYSVEQKLFVFDIVSALEENEWLSNTDISKFLHFGINVQIPQDEGIYYYTWSDGSYTSAMEAVRAADGTALMSNVNWGNAIRPERIQNGDFAVNHIFTWLGEDGQTVIGTVEFTTIVRYPAYPVDVPETRIISENQIEKSDGKVVYNSENAPVETGITVRSGAATYALVNDGRIDVVDGKISIKTAADTVYTIKWYDEGDNLLCTEKLQVSFIKYTYATAFELVPINRIENIWGETIGGITLDATQTDAEGNISGNLIFNCDWDTKAWREALLESGSSQEIRLQAFFKLPDNAISFGGFATSFETSDADALGAIKNADYYKIYGDNKDYDCYYPLPSQMANVTYDQGNAIISPTQSSVYTDQSFVIKWMDDTYTEHFCRINVKIEHESLDAVKILAIAPTKERIEFNGGELPLSNVSYSYEDGTIIYYLNKQFTESDRLVTVVIPPEGAVSVDISTNADYAWGEVVSGEAWLKIIPFDDYGATFNLKWKDVNGNTVTTERIDIRTLPVYNGIWLDKNWVSVSEDRTGIFDGEGIQEHLSYANGMWLFDVDHSKTTTLDCERMSDSWDYLYIIPPEGAEYFAMVAGGSPLYVDGGIADVIQRSLNNQVEKRRKITEANDEFIKYVVKDGKGYLAVNLGGYVLNKTTLDGTDIAVYTVNQTSVGTGMHMHFQWYKEDGDGALQLISFEDDNGNVKNGEYFYMITKSYLNVLNTEVLDDSEGITAPVTKPTAIVLESPDASMIGLKLRCEIPLQHNASKNPVDYQYYKLDLVDTNGNIVELPAGSKIKVYIPYPEGTDMNSKKEHFDVWHYHDENHGSYDRMSETGNLALKEYGITFETTSFSPFLLKYEPIETSENVAYNTVTEKSYTDIGEALLDAEAGATVQLMQDAAGSVLWVFEGITLDLNGHTLTADYVSSYGDIIDSSPENSGRVKVLNAKRMMLQKDNAQLPVRDAEGAYAFLEVLKFNKAIEENGSKYIFQPVFEAAACDLLKNGANVSGVTIKVNVSWTQDNGVRTQEFTYNDSLVQTFVEKYDPATGKYEKDFTLTLKNADAFDDLTFEAVIVSDVNAQIAAGSF